MTQDVIDFLRKAHKVIGQPSNVLEIGSLNVNGSARTVFQNSLTNYVGMDMVAGKDVDVVCNPTMT